MNPEKRDIEADPERDRILATVEEIWAAYEAGSPEFFDYFTEDASIFSLSHPVRIQGREGYRRYFGHDFQQERRAVRLLHTEVRLIGDGALVSFHNRIRVSYNSVDSRGTLLLVPEDGRLKIAHLHMSPLVVTQLPEDRGLVEEVTGVMARRLRSPDEPEEEPAG
jgi:ketosteroid isomerase-like protein